MTCKVTVKNPSLSKTTDSTRVGSKITLAVTGGAGTISWASSKSSIATVSRKGVVTGIRGGTARISATRNGVKMTCTVKVTKRQYKMSLSRKVNSGSGYIYVKARTWNGRALKKHTVKLYRSGSYVGKARTDANGVARVRVSKNRGKKAYKAVIAGDSKHYKSTAEKKLVFTYEVHWDWDKYIFDETVYLKAGTYRVDVTGTGDGSGFCRWEYQTAVVSSGSHDGDFKLTRGGYVRFWGMSDWAADYPSIEVSVVRYM